MYPVRPGWRWVEGGLWYCKEWEEEDALLSNIEVSKRAINPSMDGMVECLNFPDNWLPTLDLSIQVDKENSVNYKFYEKATSSQGRRTLPCLETTWCNL